DGARYDGAARHDRGPRLDRPTRHHSRLPPRVRGGAPRGADAARHALLLFRRLVRVIERAGPRRSARPRPRGVRRAGRDLRTGGNRAVRRARPRRRRGVLGRCPLPAARARLGLPRSREDLVGAARARRRPGPSGDTARLSRHRATAVDRNGLAGADRHGAGEDGLGPRVDLAFVTTTVSADTAALGRSLSQGALALGSSWGHGHVRVTFRSQDEDRPWQVEGSAAWIPLRPLTLAADARRAR